MKLRRAMAVAAATAVIAPAAILAAPIAFADDTVPATETTSAAPTEPAQTETPSADVTTTAPAESTSSSPAEETEEPAGETGDPAADASSTPSGSTTPSGTPSGSVTPSGTPSESEDPEEPAECEKSALDISINGLPGKIARGSGWHKFKMNVYNSSKTTVHEIDYFAGASSDKAGDDLFKSKQVSLQALDPETNTWEDLSEDGRAVGYVGQSDEIQAGYEVDIPLRINVKSTAPVGAGFTLGAGLYVGDKDCLGVSDVAYKFQIVKSGGSGSTPQTGGSAPVPSESPSSNTTGNVSGTLAETGSSSAVPMFALAGGAAVVLGAGAMFVVRRRRNGDAAA
ncbi:MULTISPECIES: LAETG motif-containing sortase-dependent surface protein [unclassified Streptomyces]|uniref:LAETG motif-containing sortase-dependent surface protein n=1 Tax=unclassified Streptomyces TaxID=2593676 RepID=UPI002DDB246F|nr:MULTISPECIES: LAETG motif-containing sortase-dependent surface protein [unclassified Streptomyces]WSF84981.1 LPXTG cell wall anchor domain-containing protein [Streptomyces sp. NBC_01744]WSC38730.1 LPXTG cell wall anchor domain-containing protein [Streptomyces sp. NBC_01763]WSC46869.1 LPXTG cell wall anchor domain-containing protein [Streptomyces sp. NBC_01762]WSC54140.1 LPXTG cell wall anchor domain-containing protein [Streptomyces sp. NBC_01761]WSD26521.1 LPXTG cell wall anchor domain-cont